MSQQKAYAIKARRTIDYANQHRMTYLVTTHSRRVYSHSTEYAGGGDDEQSADDGRGPKTYTGPLQDIENLMTIEISDRIGDGGRREVDGVNPKWLHEGRSQAADSC